MSRANIFHGVPIRDIFSENKTLEAQFQTELIAAPSVHRNYG